MLHLLTRQLSGYAHPRALLGRGVSLCAPRPVPYATLGQHLACCPRITVEVGVWLRGFRWASPTV